MHIDKFEGEAEGERAGLCTAATCVAYMFGVIGSIGEMRCAFIGARLQGAAVGSGFWEDMVHHHEKGGGC